MGDPYTQTYTVRFKEAHTSPLTLKFLRYNILYFPNPILKLRIIQPPLSMLFLYVTHTQRNNIEA
jgi:hypothetical protein